MALLLYVRHQGKHIPLELPLDAQVQDLWGAVVNSLSLRGRLEYRGKRLDDPAASLADAELGQEVQIDFVPYSRTEQRKLDKELWNTVGEGDDVDAIERLLDRGADPAGATSSRGRSLLHKAAGWGRSKSAAVLLGRGSALHAKDDAGATPLHVAAEKGQVAVVQLLCGQGANVNAVTNDGTTPLHVAAEKGQVAVVQLLCGQGAKVNAVTRGDEETTLMQAARGGHREAVEVLRAHGASVDKQDTHGFTALHRAAEHAHSDTVRVLCEEGAQVNLAVWNVFPRRTPLDVAGMFCGEAEEVEVTKEVLRRHGAEEWKGSGRG